MTAKDALRYCARCPATAAFTALMVPSNARRSSLAMVVADMNDEKQIDDAIY